MPRCEKLKKSQLAFRFGVSRAHVTRLVRADVQPCLRLALRLAKFFKQPVEMIFQLDDESSIPFSTLSRPCPAADRNHK